MNLKLLCAFLILLYLNCTQQPSTINILKSQQGPVTIEWDQDEDVLFNEFILYSDNEIKRVLPLIYTIADSNKDKTHKIGKNDSLYSIISTDSIKVVIIDSGSYNLKIVSIDSHGNLSKAWKGILKVGEE